MEKREINIIDEKKEVEPIKKRKRKPIPKKVRIYTTREKREVNLNDDYLDLDNRFNSMNDYI